MIALTIGLLLISITSVYCLIIRKTKNFSWYASFPIYSIFIVIGLMFCVIGLTQISQEAQFEKQIEACRILYPTQTEEWCKLLVTVNGR